MAAQLGLPPLARPVGDILETAERVREPVQGALGNLARDATSLADARLSRLRNIVRRDRSALELDAAGDPARRGELLLTDASEADIVRAKDAGFAVLGRERLGTLDITVVRLGIPAKRSLAAAETELKRLLPDAAISADTLHFQAGAAAARGDARPRPVAPKIDRTVGVIDGAPGPATPADAQRGFAKGALTPSHHGSAIVSLLRLTGVSRVAVADVYGTDAAGGNALAIARGLDWLVGEQGSRVVSISLVGPNNPLVARAVAAAQRRGVPVVAAVGNDGPAAPPAYPASYPGVIAVTAVDGRGRALIEAGRAAHLDYAAPGADMLAANAGGTWSRVRGTSYAVPFVAARAAAALGQGAVTAMLDRETVDLGRKGPDPVFGRGLLCANCGRKK
ncbi:S8 family serine peptidase [Novosphingobium sp. 9U]|uniref:S8 family serine peptidase n=1 Tax=Novosphingobium sp. 9U TaxID=2653158 RepID=UPI001F3BE2A9|nr:S8 family serine peptidase [Novosphingobium sp. 9U]